MGCSNGIYKKKISGNPGMRRFFHRIKCCTQGLPLSTPQPRRGFNKLNGGKVFSKIDLSEAYFQIPGVKNSSKPLCINTHRELYKFDRLVFGIKVAPAIFQQVMDTMLGGFDFTFAYLEDIVISSKTKELHREHLNKVFAQIREFGFKVLFTNPSARAGYDTRSFFKRSLTGLNSELSFS